MNTYSVEFFAKCPSNGVRIQYAATIKTSQPVMVEDILEFIEENTARPVYHEALADAFASIFPGLHEITAHHHGVTITTHRAGDADSGGSGSMDAAQATGRDRTSEAGRSPPSYEAQQDGQEDPDLTIAYMVGYAKGKDAAAAETCELLRQAAEALEAAKELLLDYSPRSRAAKKCDLVAAALRQRAGRE